MASRPPYRDDDRMTKRPSGGLIATRSTRQAADNALSEIAPTTRAATTKVATSAKISSTTKITTSPTKVTTASEIAARSRIATRVRAVVAARAGVATEIARPACVVGTAVARIPATERIVSRREI
jgi:hypothetical protein